MSLWSFGVRNPVAANLVLATLGVGGIIFGLSLRREFFPEVRPNMVVVGAPYPGATPDEVERSLATKIEDRVRDIRGVKEVTSVAVEGAATVTIEFRDGIEIEEAVAKVKREVDALQDLPPQAERIIVNAFEPNIPTISVNLVGSGAEGVEAERAMKAAIRQIQDDLRSLPGMGEIRPFGFRTDELAVEVRPGGLLEHGVSLPEVAERIRQAMSELPGGSVRSSTSSVLIRTMGAKERVDEVRRIVVKAGSSGEVVRVGDVAEVREGFADVDVLTRFNDRRSMGLTVYKVGEQDAVKIADMVKAYVSGRTGEAFEPTRLERLKLATRRPGSDAAVSDRHAAHALGASRTDPLPGEIILSSDLSRFITQRLELLARNAATGGAMVYLALLVMLNWRSANWVVLGLVVAILGTLVVMRLAGITLNLLTMFGLILVIGILVDDGIVIAENITYKVENGEEPLKAAVEGTGEVAWPVLATVLTTVFAFLPLMMIGGQIGDFLGALPLVAMCALGVSLLEGYLTLPSHMGHSLARAARRARQGRASRIQRLEARFDAWREAGLGRIVYRPYERALRACLSRPWLTLSGVVAVWLASLGMLAGERLEFVFFETADNEDVVADLRMPIGTPIEETDAIVRRLERSALAQPEVKNVLAIAGYSGDLEGGSQQVQSHLAQLFIELHPVEARESRGQRSSPEVIVGIREGAGDLPGIRNLRIEGIQGGPGGPAISLAIVGEREGEILRAAEDLKRVLGTFEGVYDIADDADSGQPELRLTLLPGASELGFTTEQVARQVRGAVVGLEAYTFAGDREDVDVRVRFPEAQRRSLAAIESMQVFTPGGIAVPMREVVRVEEARGYATIRRLDGKRVITVTASVDTATANVEQVTAAAAPVLAGFRETHPGVRIVERGRQKQMAESFSTLPTGMLVAMVLIYVTLAWIFVSFTQPFVIMATIPFAAIGMIWGHLVMGYSLTFLSLIGFVALAGVVVNDSIVFMEFFNARRRSGMGVREAAIETGIHRVRPVLLTTMTTVAGIGPLMLERSFQAKILIPMAITICFGLMAATVLVLLALPCLLVGMAQVRRALAAAWTGKMPSEQQAGA